MNETTSPTKYLETTAYLTVAVKETPWKQLRTVKATGKKPTAIPEGSVVIKIRVRVPEAAFEPLEPDVILTVPAELVQHPVEVVAQ